MKLPWSAGQSPRPFLAKLVIASSALVALATAALPEWFAEEQGQLHLVFDERDERMAILRIEVSGKLYAAAQGGTLALTTTADRAASDFLLSARPLPLDAEVSAATEAAPEADANPAIEALAEQADPDPGHRTMTWLSVSLECTQGDPPARRPKTCVEQFEITLTRRSQEALAVDVSARVSLFGQGETPPPGALQVLLEETGP